MSEAVDQIGARFQEGERAGSGMNGLPSMNMSFQIRYCA